MSDRIIDRRATHGATAVVAFVLGLFGGGLAPSADGPDFGEVQRISAALDHALDFWSRHSDANHWRDPRVVLIDKPIATPCGLAAAAVYCPADERIYVDLTWMRDAGAPLFVLAHELGHHVQRQRRDAFAELGADCLAGRWLSTQSKADVDAALELALAAGDATHGTGEQRVDALRRGLQGDLCR